MVKYITIIQISIVAVLAFSACTQASPAVPEAGTTPEANPVQTEVVGQPTPTNPVQTEEVNEPVPDQDIEGKCLRNSDETRLLINFVHGYCFQYPAEYDIAFPNETEMMVIKHSALNVSEPSMTIEVQPAGERTLGQVADQLTADYMVPGLEVERKPLTIGGEAAFVLDGLTGQDVNRQVIILHNGQLYHLYFIPMDKSQPVVYTQAEALYNTVIQSFNFQPVTSLCSDCPQASDTETGQTQEDPQTAMISGWVWHDQCDSGKDGEPPPATTPQGCVKEDSPQGPYRADGVFSTDEPLIESVVVTLGEGACPAPGIAEVSTIITDLSYSFTGLKAGTYCVFIDPQREPNFSILRPGVWTYPAVTQDVISTTVTLSEGEYKGMVNFGWDYQFKP